MPFNQTIQNDQGWNINEKNYNQLKEAKVMYNYWSSKVLTGIAQKTHAKWDLIRNTVENKTRSHEATSQLPRMNH